MSRPWRRYGTRLGVALLVMIMLLGVGAALLLAWLGSASGNAYLKQELDDIADGALIDGSLSIGELSTDVLWHWRLGDVRVRTAEGREPLVLEEISCEVAPWALLAGTLHVRELELRGLQISARQDSEGSVDLLGVFGAYVQSAEPPEPWQGLPVDLRVDRWSLEDSGVFFDDPEGRRLAVQPLSASAGLSVLDTQVALSGLDLRAAFIHPVEQAAELRGTAHWNGREASLQGLEFMLGESLIRLDGTLAGLEKSPNLAITARSDGLDLAVLDEWLGAGLHGRWHTTVSAEGALQDLGIGLQLRGADGGRGMADLQVHADLTAESTPWYGSLEVGGLYLEDLLSSISPGSVALQGRFEGEGHAGTYPDAFDLEGRFEGGPVEAYGASFEQLVAGISLEAGSVSWTDVESTGPLGRLGARGRYDIATGELDTTLGGLLRLAGLSAFGADGLAGGADVALRVTQQGNLEAAPVRVAGAFDSQPLRWGSEVSFDRAAGTLSVESSQQGIVGSVDLELEQGQAWGVAVRKYEDSGLEFSVDERTVARGSGGIRGVEVDGVAHLDLGAATWTFELDERGDMDLSAALELTDFRVFEHDGDDGLIELRYAEDRADISMKLTGPQGTVVAGTMSYDLNEARLNAPSFEIAPRPLALLRAVEPLTLRLPSEGTGVEEASIFLAGEPGRIRVNGRLATEGPLAGVAWFEETDLSVLSAVLGLEEPLQGRLTGELSASGTGAAPLLEVERLSLTGLQDGLSVSGDLLAAEGRVLPSLDVGIAGDPWLSVEGAFPAILDLTEPGPDPTGEVDLRVSLRAGGLDRFAPWAQDLPTGEVSGRLSLLGSLLDPQLSLTGVSQLDAPGWRDRARVEFGLDREGEQWTSWGKLYEGFASRLELTGRGTTHLERVFRWVFADGPEPDLADLDLYARSMEWDASVRDVPARSLARLAGLDLELDGLLSGSLEVSGSGNLPEPVGRLTWNDGRLGQVELSRADLEVQHPADGFEVVASANFASGGAILADGRVPMVLDLRTAELSDWQTGPMSWNIRGRALPLGIVSALDPDFVATRGIMQVEGSVGGTLAAPEPALRLVVQNGGADYAPLGLRINDIELAAHVDERAMKVSRFSLTPTALRPSLATAFSETRDPNRSAVEGTLTVMLEDFSPGLVEGRLDFRNALFSASPGRLLRLSGGLDFSERWPAVRVDGGLRVDQGTWVMDSASFYEVAPTRLDDNLHIERFARSAGQLLDEQDEQASFMDAFRMEVAFDVNRSLEADMTVPFLDDLGALGASVTSADIRVRLDGQGTVTLHEGDLALLGEVSVIDGTVRLLQANFALDEGIMAFVDGDYSNPILNLRGSMPVRGGQVDLLVEGRPDNPQMSFSSTAFSQPQQILTILLTGMAPDEQVGQDRVLASAGGLLVQKALGGTALRGLVIEPDGTVSVGVPVAPSVFVRTRFTPTPEADENRFTVIGEWSLGRRMVLEGAWGDEFSWADVFWELRF